MHIDDPTDSGMHRIATALGGCVLREWRASDKLALRHHADNRKVWRNMDDTFPHPYTAADADAWIAIAAQPGPSRHLAIEVDGEAAGGIGVLAGGGVSRRCGRFGYWLGEAVWGRGVATAAARAFAQHVFGTTDFVRLEARVYAWNPASARVLAKAGFALESVQPRSVLKDGELIDSALFVRLKDG